MRFLFSFLILSLFYCSCQNKQQKPPDPLVTIIPPLTIISMEDTTGQKSFSSVADIKNALFSELEAHQSDTGYHHFMWLTDTVSGSVYQAEIVIGHLFHPSLKSAVLGWSVSDSTMDIQVFQLQNTSMWSVLRAPAQPVIRSGATTGIRHEFISFRDYDFDGWKDLEVMTEFWDGIGVGYHSRLWLAHPKDFHPVQFFENIDSPVLDTEQREICSYFSGGCADMAMHFSIWQLKNAAVKMTTDIDVDCCVGRDGKCLITINDETPISVPGNKVHLYVPKYYREQLREKMSD